jgi:hypothetical protein
MKAITKSLLGIIFLGTISCSSYPKELNFKKVDDIYKPVHTVEQITEDLEFAYKYNEPDLIENIFSEWQNTVKPNTVEFINQNDTIAAIYNVFSAFLKSGNIVKRSNLQECNELNQKCKYIVIQNVLFYSILYMNKIGELERNNSRKSMIRNFRPPVETVDNNVLYLTEEYDESINAFLGWEIIHAKDEIEIHSEYQDDWILKYELLKDYLPVRPNQRENCCHFETDPYVNKIIFNKSISKAKIYFNIGSQVGTAILEKKGKNWITIKR